MKSKYYVYVLTTEDNSVLYYGRTNNINRRYKEHLRNITKGLKSLFYDYCRTNKITPQITILQSFDIITEAKRYEMFLILQRYFSNQTIYQKIPSINGF
jgi:predicted GIY-YIG superfamily endonuclease